MLLRVLRLRHADLLWRPRWLLRRSERNRVPDVAASQRDTSRSSPTPLQSYFRTARRSPRRGPPGRLQPSHTWGGVLPSLKAAELTLERNRSQVCALSFLRIRASALRLKSADPLC